MDASPATGEATELPGVGQRVVVAIERIAAGGDGVGREPSGRVVFVPRTAPGDRVEVRLVEVRARWARGVGDRWLSRGPDRRDAPCPVYGECGGCRLQHLSSTRQREAKRAVVADALQRIGGLDVVPGGLLGSGEEFGYRNRMSFTLRRRGPSVVAGLHRFDAPGALVDVDDCPLAEPAVRRAWMGLRRSWGPGARRLPAGEELRLTIRGSRRGEVDLFIEGGEPGSTGDAGYLLRSVPELVGCHREGPEGTPLRLAGARGLADEWQGFRFDLPPGVFLQVNREVSARMDDWLDRKAGDLAGRSVVDLYAGIGARAIRWASRGASVAACEVQSRAVEAGRRGAEAAGVHVRFRRARVEDALAELLPADLVIVNPPRAGLGREVTRMLAARRSGGLAYVSCDPATLARDLARLAPTWTVQEVQAFDAFPQTAHVEAIAWLERAVPLGGDAGDHV